MLWKAIGAKVNKGCDAYFCSSKNCVLFFTGGHHHPRETGPGAWLQVAGYHTFLAATG